MMYREKVQKSLITPTLVLNSVVDQCIGKHGHWVTLVVFTTAQQALWALICLF